MIEKLICLMSLVVLLAVTGTTSADQWEIPIDNPGFEDSVVADGEYDYSLDNQGWGYFDNGGEQGAWNPGLPGTSEPGYGGNAPEGQNVGWVNPGGVGVPGGFAQVLTHPDATLQADATYTLTVEVGNTLGYPWSGYKVQLLAGGTGHTPGTGADTGPVTGGTLLAEDDNSLVIAEDTFETSTVTFTYDPELHSGLLGEPLQIRLLSLGNVAAGDYTEADFDNVTLLYDGPARSQAFGPNPKDGDMLQATWATLSWRAGDFAVSHDLYIGQDFDDVNDGTEGTFAINQAKTDIFVGFPGFPVPGGLVPGTTYYWRVDEVNEADPNSPWKGDVWSFWIEPKKAYDPSPADGAKFVDPNVVLNWVGGFGAKLHTAYFGDNFDDVNSAAGGVSSATATFAPGTLELEKVYYWRVDQFDGAETHKGDVWSFTTTRSGGGLKAEYFNNTLVSGDPALTRLDPEVDFNWGSGDVPGENSPDASVNVNNFGARWTGELEVDLTDAYTFRINANNGFRLWLDGEPIINFWTNGTTSSRGSDPIELVGGESYSIRMDYFEGDDTAIAQLFWESSTRQEQIIPSGAVRPLSRAGDPSPYNGATHVAQVIMPTWRSGEAAASHQIYLGTDAEAVENATTASPEYKGSKALGEESLDPGKLAWDMVYYWRVDEINNADPDSPWKGKVWSFTTADFLPVEDFEFYNDLNPDEPGSNRVFDTWLDGFGTTTNGALVGNDVVPFMELDVVHGGFQSLPYSYDNNLKTSEATMTLVYPRDWTEGAVTKLSLWFRGKSTNDSERMFVALDGDAVVYHDDASATQITGWTEWVIDLTEFANKGVDLANVHSITLGFGTRNAPVPGGGTGTVHFDDIRLIL